MGQRIILGEIKDQVIVLNLTLPFTFDLAFATLYIRTRDRKSNGLTQSGNDDSIRVYWMMTGILITLLLLLLLLLCAWSVLNESADVPVGGGTESHRRDISE